MIGVGGTPRLLASLSGRSSARWGWWQEGRRRGSARPLLAAAALAEAAAGAEDRSDPLATEAADDRV